MDKEISKWLSRVQNLMDIQKDLQLDTISMKLTRAELIELKILFKSLEEIKEQQA